MPEAEKKNIKSAEECEKDLLALGFDVNEIKELRDIITTIIDGVLNDIFKDNE